LIRYWDNPRVLEKLSAAMGDAFNAGEGMEEGVEGEEGDAEQEEEIGVHAAASSGLHQCAGCHLTLCVCWCHCC
jgi:hypothetical protein